MALREHLHALAAIEGDSRVIADHIKMQGGIILCPGPVEDRLKQPIADAAIAQGSADGDVLQIEKERITNLLR